jgi:hypothetical protein
MKDWDKWLEKRHEELTARGYKKYFQSHKNSDFQYFKNFKDTDDYMIGVYFYDFRKYNHENSQMVSIQYECLLNPDDGRIDLSVSRDISIDEFENMSKHFYESMKHYIKEKGEST